MESALELLSICRAGAVLRTRDRRTARIHHAEPAAGLIHGEVEMHGACVWRADGRYRDAAFGVSPRSCANRRWSCQGDRGPAARARAR